jgi:GntR family transcriptional regulator
MAGADDSGEAAAGPDFRPLYAQVKELMIRRMLDGAWRPGDILPSEGRLAAEFGVSQGTVRKALDEMAAQRLLVRQQGRGTFVARHDQERSLFHFFHIVGEDGEKELPSSRILDLRLARAEREQAALLALPPRAKVYNLLRIRTLQGEAVILERIALPASLFPDFSVPVGVELPDELYVLYQQKFGVTIVRAKERLRAVAADDFDASYLGVAVGTPLLEIDRVAISLDGVPVERRVSRCNTVRHRYAVEVV